MNHFIEIGYDESDRVWVTIHSGSRSIGHKCATRYMALASESDKAKEGNYGFDTNDEDGMLYILDMNFCLEFALENRKRMMKRVVRDIQHYLKGNKGVNWEQLINRNHNHAEYNYKLDAWIHRKGANDASDGVTGYVPGNMRDGGCVVIGKGNPDSLNSSSHGAGRVLSRTKAKEQLSLDSFKQQMVGIVAKVDKGTLDESPKAYKDIFEVIKEQNELIDVIAWVKPIINIKGAGRASRNSKTKTKQAQLNKIKEQEAMAQLNDCL